MTSPTSNRPGDRIGAENRARIRQWLIEHPGGKQRECAEALGLSTIAIMRHIKKIRSEWTDKPE